MAGNGRFELMSASPDSGFGGSYSNGQRGNFSGPSLDRSGSFRESADSRMFVSGKVSSRGTGGSIGDIPPLPQCLILEPILMGEQKYGRTVTAVEAKRVFGLSGGCSSEDNSFGAGQVKASAPLGLEELKRFRTNIADINSRANSCRVKKLDDQMHRLNKYCEATSAKKQMRSDLPTSERTSGSNLKMGNQMHRCPSDIATQKLEDRPKNVMLNKRVRTSVAETRADSRNNGLPRHFIPAKDRDPLKSSNTDSDMPEEKIHRLPAGGDGWDKKMKRKRSVGGVFPRPAESDGDLKRSLHHKLTSSETSLQSSDSLGFRSGSSNGASCISKIDGTAPSASSNARAAMKEEQEKVAVSKETAAGLNKERLLGKGHIKLNNREDNNVMYPSPLTKGKASRTPRSGTTMALHAAAAVSRVSTTVESWEQPSSLSKNSSIVGAGNRKRPLPGSSSPPLTQWAGQKQQKISRTRRANLVSPVSNNEETQISPEGCAPSDIVARLTSGSLVSKGASNGIQNLKVKIENTSSPARLSESEESGAGEIRMKEKCAATGPKAEIEEKAVNTVQNGGPISILTKKNKFLNKEEAGDGVRRQGRSGRGSSFPRSSTSPKREKLDNLAVNKPHRNMKPATDRNGSKSGRPLKKLTDRRGFSRLGHVTNSGSPDCTGESDDDKEELVDAAKLAWNSSLLACSSPFWKRVEPLFAAISSEEKSYLKQQLKSAEECKGRMIQMFGHGDNMQDDHVHEEIYSSDTPSGHKSRQMQYLTELKDSVVAVGGPSPDSILMEKLDPKRPYDVVPLCQRILSAIIEGYEADEVFEENGSGGSMPLLSTTGDFYTVEDNDTCRIRSFESVSGSQLNGGTDILVSCNGNIAYNRTPGDQNLLCDNGLLQGDCGYVRSDVEVLVGLSRYGIDGPQSLQKASFGIPSYDCQYERMSIEDKLVLELQSIGINLETVPGLDEQEDDLIDQEIELLKNGLLQQVDKKKEYLDKLYKTIQEGKDTGSNLEQVAMDRLTELAYKKLLATRGSLASKNGIPKVSKHVALAFAKRTLSRCRKFESLGASCFTEPALREIIFAAPPLPNEAEMLGGASHGVARGSFPGNVDMASVESFETSNHQSDQGFARNGPISNRGKKKEVLLDDVVGNAAYRSSSTLGSSFLGNAKGKRSERDNSMRNAVTKAGRSSLGNSKGERKTKTKPKQKTAQISTSGSGFVNKFTETTHPVYPPPVGASGELGNVSGGRKREGGLLPSCNVSVDSLKDKKEGADLTSLPVNDIDQIEDLGVSSDLGPPQDLNSWFNFEVDGFQDNEAVGLDIPMDDLSDLNFA